MRGGAYFFARQDGNKIFLGTGHCGRHVNYLPTAQIPSVSKASTATRISYISYIEQDEVGIWAEKTNERMKFTIMPLRKNCQGGRSG